MIAGTLRLTGLAVALAFMQAGCGHTDDVRQPSQPVAFTTDQAVYESGEEVVLTLRNVYDQPIGYNLCTSNLRRSVNGAWEPVEENRVCTLQIETLDPGQVATFPVELPESLADGTYRYTTGVQGLADTTEPPGANQVLATNTFQVD